MKRLILLAAIFCLSNIADGATYATLQPIIDRSCTPCHATSARFQIVEFPFVSNRYDSQEAIVEAMIERIERPTGTQGTMPPTGSAYRRLSNRELEQLKEWLDAGL